MVQRCSSVNEDLAIMDFGYVQLLQGFEFLEIIINSILWCLLSQYLKHSMSSQLLFDVRIFIPVSSVVKLG